MKVKDLMLWLIENADLDDYVYINDNYRQYSITDIKKDRGDVVLR